MKTYGIIPARLQSTRLPRKLLLAETGKPLIQYAWEAAKRASSLDEVLIATDSEEIADICRKFGARAEMTGDHPSGTDRIAEVVQRSCSDADLIVNLQGDEPEMDASAIDKLVAAMQSRPDVEMATLATPITSAVILEDRACVKVVCAADGRALYFSRSPIPCYRDGRPEDLLAELRETSHGELQSPWLLHMGIYAYHPEFLLALTQLPPSRLEQLEKLEQLRALESGASILVVQAKHAARGIDTSADYLAFVERQRAG